MYDAALNLRFREYSMDSIAKTGKTINRYYHDIFNATIFDFIKNAEPVFSTFISANPQAKNFT